MNSTAFKSLSDSVKRILSPLVVGLITRILLGDVVPMPTLPEAAIVIPDEVALNAPPGVILNLFASELSKPRNQIFVPASCSWSIGSPAAVWLMVNVVVAVRAVKVGESMSPRPRLLAAAEAVLAPVPPEETARTVSNKRTPDMVVVPELISMMPVVVKSISPVPALSCIWLFWEVKVIAPPFAIVNISVPLS